MQLILDDELGGSACCSRSKECADLCFPRQHGEFIDGGKEQCRRVQIEFLVDDLNGELQVKVTGGMWTEQTKMLSVFLDDTVSPCTDGSAALAVLFQILYHLCSAPGAFQYLEFVVPFFCAIEVFICSV